MSKNPEFAKYATDLARHQDAIRSANEDLIKLSQRFGRMMPKLQKLDSPAILTWFGLYNKIKDAAKRADDELSTLTGNDQASSNPVLQTQKQEMRVALDGTMEKSRQHAEAAPVLA
jgi:hypothetical protein